jgi:homoserine dehydrogenase
MNVLNVAVAGLGTVGRETVRLLRARRAELKERLGAELRLVAVADNDVGREARALGLAANVVRYRDPLDMAKRAEADLFVELLGGLETPRRFALAALGRGKALVTANKRLPAHAWNWDDRVVGPSLAEGKAMVEGAVIGGANQWATLRDGTADEARAEATDAVEQTDGIGIIVGPGCVLPAGVPDENVVALVKALGGTVRMIL